jgi:hypothetical protein
LAVDGAGAVVTRLSRSEVSYARSLHRVTGCRQAFLIELRHFAGLTREEAAQLLGTSASTMRPDLRFPKG